MLVVLDPPYINLIRDISLHTEILVACEISLDLECGQTNTRRRALDYVDSLSSFPHTSFLLP